MKKHTTVFMIASLLAIAFSLCIGRYPLSMTKIVRILCHMPVKSMDHTLFYQVRLPRTLYVYVAGGMLSVAGLIYQTVFLNPLVSPDVLGVSSGCSIGAILAILMPQVFLGTASLLPFVCGLLTVLFAVLTAHLFRGDVRVRMVLAGIITGSLCNAVIMTLKYAADPNRELPAMEYWLMGTFQSAGWSDLLKLLPVILLVGILLAAIRWRMNVFGLVEEEARSLGVNVSRLRFLTIGLATLLVASVVSEAGIVAWIGLIAPHIAKLISGSRFSDCITISFFTGSLLLTVSDLLARSLLPSELPISILTSFIGAVLLFAILIKRKNREKAGN